MTDCQMIFQVLSDMKPHHVQEIFERCKPSARNWAVRSRIADLRNRLKPEGFKIISKIASDRQAIYQIVKEEPKSQPERESEPRNRQSEAPEQETEQLELIK